jgi:integrase
MNLEQLSSALFPAETVDEFISKAINRELAARAELTFIEAAALYRKAERSTRYLSLVETYWFNTPVGDISPAAVRQAAIELLPDAVGATRNRQVITPTIAVINHAAEFNRCKPLSVRRFPVIRKRPVPVDWPWIQAFMAEASPHLGALACFMFLTGARISEALALTWNDINLANSTARIFMTKVQRERVSHLPEALISALQLIEPEDYVFKYATRHSAKDAWRKCIDQAGIAHRSYHACRHGFATSLLHAGIDPITVAELGGWATPDLVFETYGHARSDRTLPDVLVGHPGLPRF